MSNIKSFPSSFCADLKEWLKRWGDAVVELFTTIRQFFFIDIWRINIREQKPFHYYMRVVARTIGIKSRAEKGENVKFRLGIYTSSLSYFSILAFIPFIAAMFFVTRGFGLDGYLENIIHQTFDENKQILVHLLNLADNIISSSKNGIFTFFRTFVRYSFTQWTAKNGRPFSSASLCSIPLEPIKIIF